MYLHPWKPFSIVFSSTFSKCLAWSLTGISLSKSLQYPSSSSSDTRRWIWSTPSIVQCSIGGPNHRVRRNPDRKIKNRKRVISSVKTTTVRVHTKANAKTLMLLNPSWPCECKKVQFKKALTKNHQISAFSSCHKVCAHPQSIRVSYRRLRKVHVPLVR